MSREKEREKQDGNTWLVLVGSWPHAYGEDYGGNGETLFRGGREEDGKKHQKNEGRAGIGGNSLFFLPHMYYGRVKFGIVWLAFARRIT